MKKFLTVILWFSCLPFMYADSQGMQNTEIAGVKNGELREAVASWWGFNSGDATECLQKAIDSGVKKLIVDNTGREWLVGPIRLRSGQEIVFADGVVVRALPGAFKAGGKPVYRKGCKRGDFARRKKCCPDDEQKGLSGYCPLSMVRVAASDQPPRGK